MMKNKVILVGAGGVGFYAAQVLKTFGFDVVVFDDDVVEPKNLNRVPLQAYVGRPKAEVVGEIFGVQYVVGKFPDAAEKEHLIGVRYIVDATDAPDPIVFQQVAEEIGATYVRAGYDWDNRRADEKVSVLVGVPVFGETEPGYTAQVSNRGALAAAFLLAAALRQHLEDGEPVVLDVHVKRLVRSATPKE